MEQRDTAAALSVFSKRYDEEGILGGSFTNCEWRFRLITVFRRDLSTQWVDGGGDVCATIEVH
jgi:hypothetical protein